MAEKAKEAEKAFKIKRPKCKSLKGASFILKLIKGVPLQEFAPATTYRPNEIPMKNPN